MDTIRVCHDCPYWDFCTERIGGERRKDCPAPHLSQKPKPREGQMEKKKTVQEVLHELYDQVHTARMNKQPGVVRELLKKIDRIEKRAKKGGMM